MTRFSDDARCRELLETLRWPAGPRCIRCGGIVSRRNEILICYACHYEFRVTTGTIFGDTHLPLEKWFMAVLLLCEARKGMSANQLKRTLGISYKTAWYLCHRIRAAMATAEHLPLASAMEIDGAHGGVEHGADAVSASGKDILLGIRQRHGGLRFICAEDVRNGTLTKFVQEHVRGNIEVIVTEDSSNMPPKSKTARRSTSACIEGDIHTNRVKSAFSLFKRGIVGSWHKVSAKHITRYLAEMEFRFNRRNGYDLFIETLCHMVSADPLSFAKLVK